MQAVILCGGLGTRLRGAIGKAPKALSPIAGRPFLDILIKQLRKNSFTKFLLLTGYQAEIIEKHFPEAVCCRETQPLGTGGALLNAWSKLDEEFCLINGDTFFDIDYALLFNFVRQNDLSVCLALRATPDIQRYGYVALEQDFKISAFVEKTALPPDIADGYINGGIYYFQKKTLAKYQQNYSGTFISLEKEILPELLQRKMLSGLPLGGKFIDIGVPEDYTRAQTEIPQWLEQKARPALFLDRDNTIIRDPHGAVRPKLFFYADTLNLVKEYQKKGYLTIMVSNQAGLAKGLFTVRAVEAINKMVQEKYAAENLKIDQVFYCPYHLDGKIERYKKYSVSRKPQPGMLLAACEQFKINLAQSLMCGDNKETDRIKLPYLPSKIITRE
ncbi:MAG: HAD-IIIA family hydrolase [Candidatus Margulisbacteria bacterium]|jgi:D,D-heptose 1,7-bisphosphate phosphatase|nr:HAD-IIIA family hydrolase [Candidatus Margulisiibacteriota bacterium]